MKLVAKREKYQNVSKTLSAKDILTMPKPPKCVFIPNELMLRQVIAGIVSIGYSDVN